MSSRKTISIVRVVLALAGASLASIAIAASPADELREINESIAILTARKTELQLKHEVMSKAADIKKLSSSAGDVSGTESSLPIVGGIEGMDGNLSATLLFTGGVQQIVKQGEKIHGNWTVGKVDVSSVTLIRGSERVRLSFGSEPTTAAPSGPGRPAAPYFSN